MHSYFIYAEGWEAVKVDNPEQAEEWGAALAAGLCQTVLVVRDDGQLEHEFFGGVNAQTV